ncbi:MAG: autotransporter outer membrane beta-barrel domain-containing protein, partial [Alphaproteobacteria bacterium]|nr:autotransporter outer membrane beta-barrel domain-containing protein [Alphaproteobacteria bacterium]
GGLLRVGMKLRPGQVAFEPFAGFNYKNIIVDEHSNGVDTIAEYNQEMLRAELGLTTAYQIALGSGDAIVPYVRLEGGYDLTDEATLTSIDGTGTITGNPENVDLGNWVSRAATGVSFLTRDNYSISGEYEYEFRDNYEAHIGKIKGRMKF